MFEAHKEEAQLGLIADLLVADFNRIIEGPSISRALGLRYLRILPETNAFLNQQPQGEDVKYLNRFLFEDVFPGQISPCSIRDNYLVDWPSNLPVPQRKPPKDSDENVADELCLVTCAFLLHHELAHIRLAHNADAPDEVSIAQEKEADNEAADWLLRDVDVESPIFVKRVLGVVQATLLTTAIGLYDGNLGGKSHTFSHDRLTSLLDRFLGKRRHIAKAIAFAVLDLHFNNSGRKMKKQVFPGPEEALDALCDQLAEEARTRSAEVENR